MTRSESKWSNWYQSVFNGQTTEQQLRQLCPELDDLQIIKYAHVWELKNHYPPYLARMREILRDCPLDAMQEFVNPDRNIAVDGLPVPYVRDLVKDEIAERFLLGKIKDENENTTNSV